MLTSSHAYWAWRALPPTALRPAAILGTALPDLPALGLAATLLARGHRDHDLVRAIYHRPPWRQLHLATHSALGPAALAVAGVSGAARSLAAGWAAHLSVDFVTHHDDAWPPLWPLSQWRWRSPISYWQRDHHARRWVQAETAGLVLAIATDDQPVRRVAGLGALAVLVPDARRGLRRLAASIGGGRRPPAG